jgi:hypothetical protein
MHNVAMFVPSRPGLERDHFGSEHSSFLGCLMSCLPLLVDMQQEAWMPGQDGIFVDSFHLSFASECDWQAAQMSKEWVDLVDATSHSLDWESAEIHSGMAEAAQ